MRTSTMIRSSLLLLAASLALAACEPRTTPEATPPAASPPTPTMAPTAAPTADPVATTTAAPTATPTSTPIARPEMPATGPTITTFDAKVDREPLLKLGCKVSGDALVCGTPSTPKGDGITCGEYSQPNDLLGGLAPKTPITACDAIGRG